MKKKIASTIGGFNIREVAGEVNVRRAVTDTPLEAVAEEQGSSRLWTRPEETNLWNLARNLQKGLHTLEGNHLPDSKNGRSIQAVRAAESIAALLAETKAMEVYAAGDNLDRPSIGEPGKGPGRHRRRRDQSVNETKKDSQILAVGRCDEGGTVESSPNLFRK